MNDLVRFTYTNHKGEVASRLVRPIRLWWGSTAWHREAQWLLEAFDLDKRATRDFAMSELRDWERASATDLVEPAALGRVPNLP
jgi:predicted DNA-binding transcriptional regulator YafY